ncbi:XRE family transcriptional regulator [Streptomyces sp. R33]|uniref:XRE family transcriptional regulator n=1 Tax=Streptomyces sp. R33 TaxID=3238629 RepID=A0AB39Y9Q0_9ACTN
MTNLLRKGAGQPIRDAMKRRGLTAETLAGATRAVDATGRGISLATVNKVAGRGETAVDACRPRTAWLITVALDERIHSLFDMPGVSTTTVER